MSNYSLQIIEAIEQQAWLDKPGSKLTKAIRSFYHTSPATMQLRDFLHGVWLGHPLHALITDVTMGAYSTTAALDMLELAGSKRFAPGADAALVVGVTTAAAAAAAGATDWHHTSGPARKVGLVHAMLNASALLLYLLSLGARKSGRRRAGIGFSLLGFLLTTGAGWLGGHLVFAYRVGPNAAPVDELPKKFVPVMDESELEDDKPKRVWANDIPLVVVRQDGRIRALADTCSHLGGPLSEGKLCEDGSISCPWHGSRFNLENGEVVQGPAVYTQPSFETRVRAGKVEVRVKPDENLRQ